MRFGRDDVEWDELRQAADSRLHEVAAAQGITTYGELNTLLTTMTGLPAFDLGSEGGRHALGQLLGDVSREDYPSSGVLLSALCTHKGGADVGRGFFDLAVQLGLLPPRSSAESRDVFWVKAVQSVHAAAERW
jgi:hypothetical protein